MQMLQPLDPSITSFSDDVNRCKKWIVDALEYAHNSHSFEQVIDIVKRGDAQFWAFSNSAIVTEIIGRKGWEKVLKGYEPTAIVLVKEI